VCVGRHVSEKADPISKKLQREARLGREKLSGVGVEQGGSWLSVKPKPGPECR
jgi:hypothetical protein